LQHDQPKLCSTFKEAWSINFIEKVASLNFRRKFESNITISKARNGSFPISIRIGELFAS
jgi:hypothetical protein